MYDKIKKKLRKLLKHWGLGEAEADVFATLAMSDGLTAKDIANELGYAYSTTINCLNNLMRMGYVERDKKDRKFVYFANTNFVKFVDDEIKKIKTSLKEIAKEIYRGGYKEKLRNLAIKIENAIKYLESKKDKVGG